MKDKIGKLVAGEVIGDESYPIGNLCNQSFFNPNAPQIFCYDSHQSDTNASKLLGNTLWQ